MSVRDGLLHDAHAGLCLLDGHLNDHGSVSRVEDVGELDIIDASRSTATDDVGANEGGASHGRNQVVGRAKVERLEGLSDADVRFVGLGAPTFRAQCQTPLHTGSPAHKMRKRHVFVNAQRKLE